MDPLKVALLVPVAVAVAGTLSCYQLSAPYFAPFISIFVWYVSRPSVTFTILFLFQYLRLLVHLFSDWLLYRPAPVSWDTKYKPHHCSIIIPSVDPHSKTFIPCLESVLLNGPRLILIVTDKIADHGPCERRVANLRQRFPSTTIEVLVDFGGNEESQISCALSQVHTPITVLLDDHAYWPSSNFLTAAISPFHDESIGAVSTNKYTQWNSGFSFKSFWTKLEALHDEQQNFENRATNAIDGGVSVISSITGLYRTRILQDRDFHNELTNKKSALRLTSISIDDFITKWIIERGWRIKFQHCSDSSVKMLPDVKTGSILQNLQVERTMWITNFNSLITDSTMWTCQPWSTYAIQFSTLFNFALFVEAALIYTLTLTSYGSLENIRFLLVWIFISKTISLIPYLLHHPSDMFILPGYIVFTYCPNFLRLYARSILFKTVDQYQSADVSKQKKTEIFTFTADIPKFIPSDLIETDAESESSPESFPSTPSSHLYPSISGSSGDSESTHIRSPSEADIPLSATSSDRSQDKYHSLMSPIDYSKIFSGSQHTTPCTSPLPSIHSNHSVHSNSNNKRNSKSNHSHSSTKFSIDNHFLVPTSDSPPSSRPSSSPLSSARTSITSISSLFSPFPSPSQSPSHPPAPPSLPLPSSFSTSPNPIQPTKANTIPQTKSKSTPRPQSTTRTITRTRTSTLNPYPYKRSWTRGEQCNQLHYEGCKLTSCGGCLVEDVWDLGRDVVLGRPRF